MTAFRKAVKAEAKLRLCLIGPSGSGKTLTSLKIAAGLGGPVAVIDSERGSSEKYADDFDFDVCELESFNPMRYVDALESAAGEYPVVIIDSLSHAWSGKDGALEMVDKSKNKSSFNAWGEVTPVFNTLIDTITSYPGHVIATLRTKMAHSQERDEKTGKTVVKKIGLQPVFRDGVEYEFDVVADLDLDNVLTVTNTRCPLLKGAVIPAPDEAIANTLNLWLSGAKIDDLIAEARKEIGTHLGHDVFSDDEKAQASAWLDDPANRELSKLRKFIGSLEERIRIATAA